ncbi:MAG: cysteine desulfurase family protein [Peptococcaceae bacterium]
MMLYFDNSATTPVNPQVIAVMTDVLVKHFGNPSSLHQKGVRAEKLLNKAREIVASTLAVDSQEIIFTSGGTEGDNLAVKGVALNYWQRGKHIITTKIEHPAVREACRQLQDLEFAVTYLDVNKEGVISVRELAEKIRPDTILVSIMQVNNEVGSIQPLAEAGELLKKYPGIIFHVDGVQGFLKVPLKIKEWGIDLYTVSGHKIHGPKGAGALFVREGISLAPLLAGGRQERGLRAGTENLPGIVGLAKSCQIAREIFVANWDKMVEMRNECLELLCTKVPRVVINGGHTGEGSPYIINFSVPGLKGEVLVHALEEEQIYVSTGSACSSKGDITSPVLEAMGIAKEISRGAVRVSFAYDTTKKDVELFVDTVAKVVGKLINRR